MGDLPEIYVHASGWHERIPPPEYSSLKRAAAKHSAQSEIEFKRQMMAAREQAGYSMREMAELMGWDVEDINQFERLDSDPRLSEIREYLTRCGAALDIRVAEWGENE